MSPAPRGGAAVSTAPVTVAIVSFQTRRLLLHGLAALAPDADAGRARVCVVDNGSTDGSVAAAREQAPWAEVITPERNLGFGAAVNLVAARSASPWLLAANADIALRPGALARLLASGAADPRAGAVAPRLILPGGATQHSVGPFPTVALAATFAIGAHRLNPRLADRLCLDDHWDPDRTRTVPWAVGACLLLRRAAFDAIGGFDARQWMYAEDLDLGWRLSDAGWVTRYEPAAVADHASAAATAPAFGADRRRRAMAATYAVIARRRGPATARITAAVNLAGTVARIGWMAPAALIAPQRRDRLRDTWGWLAAHREGLASHEPSR